MCNTCAKRWLNRSKHSVRSFSSIWKRKQRYSETISVHRVISSCELSSNKLDLAIAFHTIWVITISLYFLAWHTTLLLTSRYMQGQCRKFNCTFPHNIQSRCCLCGGWSTMQCTSLSSQMFPACTWAGSHRYMSSWSPDSMTPHISGQSPFRNSPLRSLLEATDIWAGSRAMTSCRAGVGTWARSPSQWRENARSFDFADITKTFN